jgi:hypothetical protein
MERGMNDGFHRREGSAVLKAAQEKKPVFAIISISVDEEAAIDRTQGGFPGICGILVPTHGFILPQSDPGRQRRLANGAFDSGVRHL